MPPPPEYTEEASDRSPNRGDDRRFTLWDASTPPPPWSETVYLWRGHNDQGSARSLLKYAEGKSEQFRAKYLEWIHHIGHSRVDGKRVIDHLALGHGLSYWWLTRVTEKNPYTSPISDVVRLLALEDILGREQIHSLLLVSPDRRLAAALESL